MKQRAAGPGVRQALCAGALGLAACVRSGGGARGGTPIDARGDPPERVACQALLGHEHEETEVVATTMLGLAPRKVAARSGQESGVRAHPTDPDVVVYARQLRVQDPRSTDLFVSSVRGAFADVRLTRDGAADVEPCWSEDGSRVLFASDRGGAFQLWQIDRDGAHLAPLTAGAEDRAPDARAGRIVFSRTTSAQGGRQAAIWIMNADGSALAPLTSGTGAPGSGEFVPGDHEPALAPDASSVVFVRRTAADQAASMRLELPGQRLAALSAGGEDRLPRFLGADRLLVARTAPAAGILGRRIVVLALDGSDVVQLTLDARLACTGVDVLAGARPWPSAAAQPTPSQLDDDDAHVVVGQRTLGRFELVRSRDGASLQLATVPFDGKEVAGVFLPFRIGLPQATAVARALVRATFALTLADDDARVRISVKDYVRNRYDVAWDGAVPNTRTVDAAFTFASLAHVDRDGWIRIELAAELPAGMRAELALDAVTVDVFARAP